MLEIVAVPVLSGSATALDVAAADMQAAVIVIEKAGSAAVVVKVVVERRTLHWRDQSGAKAAAWAVIDVPIRTEHLAENLHPCQHGSNLAGAFADH